MYIENAGLSPFHASIQFTDTKTGKPMFSNSPSEEYEPLEDPGHYILEDHDSQTGTFLSIKHAFSEH